MSLFELTFTLTSVILGLALTQMAASIHKLAYAGRRVRWAPEPVLLATIVLTVIVFVWLDQWSERNAQSVTVGRMLLQVLKMMAIYIAAASVLPDPKEGEGVDLHGYYEGTRYLTYGALITGLLLFDLYWMTGGKPIRWSIGMVFQMLLFPTIYASLILIRWRPYHIVALVGAVIFWLSQIVGTRIAMS